MISTEIREAINKLAMEDMAVHAFLRAARFGELSEEDAIAKALIHQSEQIKILQKRLYEKETARAPSIFVCKDCPNLTIDQVLVKAERDHSEKGGQP